MSGLPAIQSIALLLPLSSAWQRQRGGYRRRHEPTVPTVSDPNRRPAIVAIDSDQYDDAASAYQGAIDRGADDGYRPAH
ncbi:MAG: hypothetical protein CM15mP74_01240 [Halieaceae bacterium]|nr:MAG: hypothetical protein CM15mP74_01240 [Halieaceae bacterium]